jgi:hypothetical protein
MAAKARVENNGIITRKKLLLVDCTSESIAEFLRKSKN